MIKTPRIRSAERDTVPGNGRHDFTAKTVQQLMFHMVKIIVRPDDLEIHMEHSVWRAGRRWGRHILDTPLRIGNSCHRLRRFQMRHTR